MSASAIQAPLKGWRLAHIGLGSTDPTALAGFYQEYVGLGVSARDGDAVFLTTDAHHHCVAIYPSAARTLQHVALEVRDVPELERIAARLDELGIKRASSDTDPGAEATVAFETPDDLTLELCAGVRSTDVITTARALRPAKLGHVGIRVRDIDRSLEFYTDVMGFRVSDWIGHQVVFMRCNSDHHAVVLIADPPADGASALQHVAFEGDGWDSFRRQADHLATKQRQLEWGPGRHGPSGNVFMYFRDDDGNRIEWMTDAGMIWDDEVHEEKRHDPQDPQTWNTWQVMPPAGFLTSLDSDVAPPPQPPVPGTVRG